MKKSVRILAVVLALLMVSLVFVACGTTLSGKYSAEAFGTGTTLEFSGSKVTMTFKLVGFSGDPIEGTYEIKDDKISIKLTEEDETGVDALIKKTVESLIGEQSFEKTDDGIKIGGVEYKKAD